MLRPGETPPTRDLVLAGSTQGPEPLTRGLLSDGDRRAGANRPSGFTGRAEIRAIHTEMSQSTGRIRLSHSLIGRCSRDVANILTISDVMSGIIYH